MTHDEALEALADHPHCWRFRQLVEDDSDPDRRDAYRAFVVREALGEPHAPPATNPVPVSYGDAPAAPCGGCPGAVA